MENLGRPLKISLAWLVSLSLVVSPTARAASIEKLVQTPIEEANPFEVAEVENNEDSTIMYINMPELFPGWENLNIGNIGPIERYARPFTFAIALASQGYYHLATDHLVLAFVHLQRASLGFTRPHFVQITKREQAFKAALQTHIEFSQSQVSAMSFRQRQNLGRFLDFLKTPEGERRLQKQLQRHQVSTQDFLYSKNIFSEAVLLDIAPPITTTIAGFGAMVAIAPFVGDQLRHANETLKGIWVILTALGVFGVIGHGETRLYRRWERGRIWQDLNTFISQCESWLSPPQKEKP